MHAKAKDMSVITGVGAGRNPGAAEVAAKNIMSSARNSTRTSFVDVPRDSLVHGTSPRANVVDLSDFRRRRGAAPVLNARHPTLPGVPAQSRTSERLPNLFDYFGAALIVLSVAVGPMLMWLLVG